MATKTVTEEDNWSWSFTNLPKFKAGTEITYTIEESAVTGYETTVNGYNVTNTHTPETVEVAGSKTWNDADNQDGKRPESIAINLLADGTVIKTVTVTETDGWAWSFTDLPKYAAGNEITYTITEDAVADYTTEVDGYNVTNSHEPAKVGFSGSKTWNDADNQDGIRPESITINLLADGKVAETKTVTAADNWAWTFSNLPKYRDQGVAIVYAIEEIEVYGYTSEIVGYSVTNTHTPATVEVKGSKTWDDANNQDGIRPESITINLLANGEVVATKTVTAEDNWAWSFTDLPKYKDQGTEIVYTITEEAVKGYTTTINDFNVTNSHEPEVTSVSGSKTWNDADDQDGVRPESITINLLADDVKIKEAVVTADEEGSWTYEFTNLPKYRDHGVEIVYTITEEAVEGYTTTIDVFDVTNTHEPELTSVSGSKIWDDADDQDGVRPESITINLLADGTEIKEAVVAADEEGNWTYEFTDLPKYRDHGTEIVYTVEEMEVEGYEASYTDTKTGYDIVNKHIPLVGSIKVTKRNVDAISEELLYVGEATFYVALFEDEALTQRVGDVQSFVFTEGQATAETVFENLKKGTYYIAETDADGNVITGGEMLVEDDYEAVYTASYPAGTSAAILEDGQAAELGIDNTYIVDRKDYYIEKSLTITKKVKDSCGKALETDETFYAGIFANAEYTTLADNVDQNIVALAMNGESSVTAEVKVSVIANGTPVNLYITEVTEDGTPVADTKDFGYEVTVKGGEVTINAESEEVSVKIINQEIEEIEETEVETEETEETEAKDEAVKTGDEAPLTSAMLAMVLSGLLMMVLAIRRRRYQY